jgi:protein TonB
MLNQFRAQNNLDEIVFANRNKAYGAYQIRKAYNNSVVKALGLVLSSFIVLFFFSLFYTPPTPRQIKKAIEQVVEVTQNVIEMEIPVAQTAALSGATSNPASDQLTIVADRLVVQTISAATASLGSSLGTSTQITGALTGPSGLPSSIQWSGAKPQQPLEFVEVMPAFGDEGDLAKYLQNQLNYPKLAMDNNIMGVVEVVFDIDAKGQVSNVNITKGIGFGCDEEAMRVIANMPQWKPGIQNGRAVPVRLRLPISFSYN